MVAGHLTVKNGNYYAVLNYKNAAGQRKTKWISLGLPEKGNKRKAEAELAKIRAEFEIPEQVGELSSDMLFADYLADAIKDFFENNKARAFSEGIEEEKYRYSWEKMESVIMSFFEKDSDI